MIFVVSEHASIRRDSAQEHSAPTAAILRIFNQEGLGIDASSGHEIERAIRVGFGTESISLSTQEMPENFAAWVEDGVKFNLCSLHQIRRFAETCPRRNIGLRFNPGLGSGSSNRTNERFCARTARMSGVTPSRVGLFGSADSSSSVAAASSWARPKAS